MPCFYKAGIYSFPLLWQKGFSVLVNGLHASFEGRQLRRSIPGPCPFFLKITVSYSEAS
jgi:hypothetical protein